MRCKLKIDKRSREELFAEAAAARFEARLCRRASTMIDHGEIKESLIDRAGALDTTAIVLEAQASTTPDR
jgi:hypothetical protein